MLRVCHFIQLKVNCGENCVSVQNRDISDGNQQKKISSFQWSATQITATRKNSYLCSLKKIFLRHLEDKRKNTQCSQEKKKLSHIFFHGEKPQL